jgi:pimeloyl-ACP methyl ester carboxylesterase
MSMLQSLRCKVHTVRKATKLTKEQRVMYASEKQMNFRKIAKLCATRSRYVLTADDLAAPELQDELAQIGQFTEVAYSILPPEYVFEHLGVLSRADFPLEGYDALLGTTLVQAFRGGVADLPGFVAYRAQTKQLIVAFSGTATVRHALYDVHFRKKRHPAGRGCAAHAGFYKLYRGVREYALEGIRKGLDEHDVQELVVTGHSMGGAVSFALDLLMSEDNKLLGSIPLVVVAFGAPRVGNPTLVQVWRDAVRDRREKLGARAMREYHIKAFNDGNDHSLVPG